MGRTIAGSPGIKAVAGKFGWPLRRMKVCELTLSYDCNARCVFCYSSPELAAWKGRDGLDFRKASGYLMSSYKTGARMVQFIGGEPTICEDLPKLIRLAAKIGYPAIQLVSNGLRLSDPDYARELVGAGLNTTLLSLHGDNAALHDRVTGIKGAFRKTLRAAENLLRLGGYLNIGTAVTGMNYKNLPRLIRLVTENFGIDSCHIVSMHYIGAAYKNRSRLRIAYKAQLPYVEEALRVFYGKVARPAFNLLSNYLPCLLPGRENVMSDWKYPELDDDLFLPDAVYRDRMYGMITDNLRMKAPSCRTCVYYRACAGFEKEYFTLYGASEFKPLLSKPAPLGPGPVYF
jgi:MoaA/NifB/PqqE/SkfB family radical SAM enzyme